MMIHHRRNNIHNYYSTLSKPIKNLFISILGNINSCCYVLKFDGIWNVFQKKVKFVIFLLDQNKILFSIYILGFNLVSWILKILH